ncbi:unnamed protein product [Diatraea saccharalis]|uniref:Uncharacterized protein n=1 Tax=Diatraea saccharalis TaxID=40085 RepID=A0A9N9QVP5_9NEOP|nr:unnamed protein product [Diatraea saccharalis]
MTIVWYLGWARHEQNVAAPAAFRDEVNFRDGSYDANDDFAESVAQPNTKNDESYHYEENLASEIQNEENIVEGDVFAASELLPVAEKLIAKVGKGIVSSAKNSQHLADKLFEQF